MGTDTRSGNRRNGKGRKASTGRTVMEYVVLAVVAVAVALLIQVMMDLGLAMDYAENQAEKK